MKVPFDTRLPALRGLGLAVAMLWLAGCGITWAQFSFGDSAPAAAGRPAQQTWPAVDWGIEPTFDPESTSGVEIDATPKTLSLDSGNGQIVMRFRASEEEGLGPPVSVVAPPPGEVAAGAPKELTQQAGLLRLGDVSFKRTAESFNLGKKGVAGTEDLSRRLGVASIAQNVVAPIPITGWTIMAIVGLAVIVALVIGYYESDKDDHDRRKKSRRRRHRHSS